MNSNPIAADGGLKPSAPAPRGKFDGLLQELADVSPIIEGIIDGSVRDPAAAEKVLGLLQHAGRAVEESRALTFLKDLRAHDYALPLFVDGVPRHVTVEHTIAVTNPSTAEVIAQVPRTPRALFDETVAAAKAAQKEWGLRPVQDRVEILIEAHRILHDRREILARLVHMENGKTLDEARQSVARGLSCLKSAFALPQMLAGRTLEVSSGVTAEELYMPRGVVAGITPFNFPVMVPMWMVPLAIGTGNAFVLKPSEQTPISANFIAEAFADAKLPPGVFSVVHGGREAVEMICDHPDIKAVGFVGSSRVAQLVEQRCINSRKNVRALGGAKNHIVVLPDADPDLTAQAVVSSAMGCAGQRCMAASVLVAVGNVNHIIAKIIDVARALKPGTTLGPVISEASLNRIKSYLDGDLGDARFLLDGRKADTSGLKGYFIGPTVIDNVPAGHALACEEIFGPVLSIVRAPDLAAAIRIENSSEYGNAASIFTRNPSHARVFQRSVTSAMVGVNVGLPVPSEPFSFGGMGESRFGNGDITGQDGVRFWTELRKVTSRW